MSFFAEKAALVTKAGELVCPIANVRVADGDKDDRPLTFDGPLEALTLGGQEYCILSPQGGFRVLLGSSSMSGTRVSVEGTARSEAGAFECHKCQSQWLGDTDSRDIPCPECTSVGTTTSRMTASGSYEFLIDGRWIGHNGSIKDEADLRAAAEGLLRLYRKL